MTTNNNLAILTVNYNGEDKIRKLLYSLEYSEYKSFEVVIVDNASNPLSLKSIQEYIQKARLKRRLMFPVTIIKNKVNSGWGMGLNLGLDYIYKKKIPLTFIVNNDLVIAPQSLGAGVKFMHDNQKCGLCGAKILNENLSIQTVGGVTGFMNSLTGLTFNNKKRMKATSPVKFNKNEYVDDCAVFVRTKLIGDFKYPSYLFMYFEEQYLNVHIRNKNYDTFYNPNVVVSHKQHGSSSGDSSKSALSTFYVNRNRWIYMKDFKKYWGPIMFANYFLFILPGMTALYLLKKRKHLLSPMYSGIKSGLTYLRIGKMIYYKPPIKNENEIKKEIKQKR